MKRLSKINEGMFSGMVRRANTDLVKKEDEIIPDMTRDEMFHYIIEHYEPLYTKIPSKTMESSFHQLVEGISFPVVYYDDRLMFRLRFHYDYKDKTQITLIYVHRNAIDSVPELNDLLRNNYKLGIMGDEPNSTVAIFPKDGNENDLDNTFLIHLIDNILENVKTPGMKKVKGVNEGMFSGMVRRANTDLVKKEDDVNDMDIKEFCDYLNSRYEGLDSEFPKIEIDDDTDDFIITAPVIKEFSFNLQYKYKRYVYIYHRIDWSIPDFKNKMSDDFQIYTSMYYKIFPKKGDVNNQFFIKVLNKILSLTDKPGLRKK